MFDKELRPRKQTKFNVMGWSDYQSIETIHEWLDSLQTEFPTWVTVSTIGHSFQGRALKLLKLSKKTVIKKNINHTLTDKNLSII
mgnify:CR=1 FL=1